jgi:C-terminal processing protease CtpA/Prc/predicted Zn-dependent protease
MRSRGCRFLLFLGVCTSLGTGIAAQDHDPTVLALMHRAAEERRRGDLEAASGTYRLILQYSPRMFEARLFLGDTLRRLRRDAEAERELRAAAAIRPEDPLAYAGISDIRRESFRFAEALAILDEGMRSVPAEARDPLLYARATTLRQSGDAAGAVILLRGAVKSFPSSSRLREALARGHLALGEVDAALAAWEEAVRLAPENPAFRLSRDETRDLARRLSDAETTAASGAAGVREWEDLARARFVARQYAQAADAAREALRREPRRGDLRLLRGLALARSREPGRAETALRDVPVGEPEHLLASYHRAWLARRRGAVGSEERIWREAVGRHPRDSTARLMLVLAWKRSGELEDRVADLLAKTGPAPKPKRLLLAAALEEADRPAEAARVLADLYLDDPSDPESSARMAGLLSLHPALLGEWLEGEGDPDGAGDGEDGPDRPLARGLLRAQLLFAAGREKEAGSLLRRAAARFPGRAEARLALASFLETTGGNAEEIARELERAVALAPGSVWPHLQRGLWLLRSGDEEGAIREGERVIELAPDTAEGHQLLGTARRAAADFPGAIRDLRRALLLDPADSPGVIRFQISLALAAQGDFAEARSALEGDLPAFPELMYRQAWIFARQTFLDRSLRGQDWLAWRSRYEGRLASPNDACAAVAEMLDSLGDPYTRLRGREETEAIYLRPRSDRIEFGAGGAPSAFSRTVVQSDLGENLGYIRLTNLSDPNAREAIRRSLEEMAEREGLILDLRGNVGGIAADADAIASLLLEPGELAARERTRYGETDRPVPRTRPMFLRKPLVVLTDRRTGSAAERLAAGLQGAGRATVVGEETFGKGAGQVGRLLPGGAMVLVTAVENVTRTGAPIRERGVLPDVPASDAALEKAREILKKQEPESGGTPAP